MISTGNDNDRRLFSVGSMFGRRVFPFVISIFNLDMYCTADEIERALKLEVDEDMPIGSWTLLRIADAK